MCRDGFQGPGKNTYSVFSVWVLQGIPNLDGLDKKRVRKPKSYRTHSNPTDYSALLIWWVLRCKQPHKSLHTRVIDLAVEKPLERFQLRLELLDLGLSIESFSEPVFINTPKEEAKGTSVSSKPLER